MSSVNWAMVQGCVPAVVSPMPRLSNVITW